MPDIFDSTVLLEEDLIQQGLSEGIKAGREAGLQEGKQLGVLKGFEVGQEAGFYRGCILTWRAMLRQKPEVSNDRIEKGLVAMQDMVDNFPMSPQDERLQDAMAELRGKFKAIVSMLGMNSQYFPTGPHSVPTGF